MATKLHGGSIAQCQYCGGQLELVRGTDPVSAGARKKWQETYECTNCDRIGLYAVDERNGLTERFTGACKAKPLSPRAHSEVAE